ncbi:hypothetical protein [Streptomyces sp. NPDC088261]|uniref:hypothetical protein n=1 Tax=Streptomyces sp. NPDC088261 TaxID=3365851 RepID=UPI00381A9674
MPDPHRALSLTPRRFRPAIPLGVVASSSRRPRLPGRRPDPVRQARTHHDTRPAPLHELLKRKIVAADYTGTTLRENLGLDLPAREPAAPTHI